MVTEKRLRDQHTSVSIYAANVSQTTVYTYNQKKEKESSPNLFFLLLNLIFSKEILFRSCEARMMSMRGVAKRSSEASAAKRERQRAKKEKNLFQERYPNCRPEETKVLLHVNTQTQYPKVLASLF